jgi:hypothetical protein
MFSRTIYSTPFKLPSSSLSILTFLCNSVMLHSNLKSRSVCSVRLSLTDCSENFLPRSILQEQRFSTGSIVARRDQWMFREGYYQPMSLLTWTLKLSPKRRWRLCNKSLRSTYEVGTICSFQWEGAILEFVDGLGVCWELPSVLVSDDVVLPIICWRDWCRWQNEGERRRALNKREWKTERKATSGEGFHPDYLTKLCINEENFVAR